LRARLQVSAVMDSIDIHREAKWDGAKAWLHADGRKKG
jgi:hypothetical protein